MQNASSRKSEIRRLYAEYLPPEPNDLGERKLKLSYQNLSEKYYRFNLENFETLSKF
jgi:hypothetical protein